MALRLPPGVTLIERGWLSSNNVLFVGRERCALVDSGYVAHSAQTLALVQAQLGGRPLDLLANTHLHSDHCGGNAAMQRCYPGVRTLVPPGQFQWVRNWDPVALTYTPTGQACPRFRADAVLAPGSEIELGDRLWQVHASPGHDPHSVILFEPASRTLLSADALWLNGFGVVFPELEGEAAFDDVGATLDLIERLDPLVVVPGHGGAFDSDSGAVASALAVARSRLASFKADPVRHARHAAKVLLKFKLLEWQRVGEADFLDWGARTPYFAVMSQRYFEGRSVRDCVSDLLDELVRSGAALREGALIADN